MTPTFHSARQQFSQGQIARKEMRVLELIKEKNITPELTKLMQELQDNLPAASLASYEKQIAALAQKKQPTPAQKKPLMNASEILDDLEELEEELGTARGTRREEMLAELTAIEHNIELVPQKDRQHYLRTTAQNIRTELESPEKEHEATINTDRRLALLRGYQGHLDGIARAIDAAQTLRTLWELSVMIDNTERQLAEQSALLEKEDVETISDRIKRVRTLHTTKSKELTPSPTTTEPTPSQPVYERDSDSDSDDDDDDDRDPWGWSNPPEPEPEDDPVASSAVETPSPETTPTSSDAPEADNPSIDHAEDIAESYVEGFWGSEN